MAGGQTRRVYSYFSDLQFCYDSAAIHEVTLWKLKRADELVGMHEAALCVMCSGRHRKRPQQSIRTSLTLAYAVALSHECKDVFAWCCCLCVHADAAAPRPPTELRRLRSGIRGLQPIIGCTSLLAEWVEDSPTGFSG